MLKKYKRTNKTTLTDDELIIFDAIFNFGGTPIQFLEPSESFQYIFNLPCHKLSSIELKETINKFIADKMVTINIDRQHYISLTEKGGQEWEKERTPIWTAYVNEMIDENSDLYEVSVYSPSLEIAKKYIKTANKCGHYKLKDPHNIEIRKIVGKTKHIFIPWKKFPFLYKISSTILYDIPPDRPKIDWALYSSERIWWKDIYELQLLL